MLSWIWPKGIIQHPLPEKTKYYNWQIECLPFNKMSAEKKDLLFYLIRSHFDFMKNTDYTPLKRQVLEYFKCHSSSPIISLHFEYFPTLNADIGTMTKKLLSCATSRTVTGHLNAKEIKVSYIDFLCVNGKDSCVKEKQLYTHYCKARTLGAPPIFLFRDKKIAILVPLTIYNIYAFPVKKYTTPNFDLPSNISCLVLSIVSVGKPSGTKA